LGTRTEPWGKVRWRGKTAILSKLTKKKGGGSEGKKKEN